MGNNKQHMRTSFALLLLSSAAVVSSHITDSELQLEESRNLS